MGERAAHAPGGEDRARVGPGKARRRRSRVGARAVRAACRARRLRGRADGRPARAARKGGRRTVRPYATYLHRGRWYLAGFCLARQDDRLFRVDRIRSLRVTERTFSERKDVRAETGARSGTSARIRFTPTAAPWVRERFADQAKALPDGGVEVELQGATRDWIVSYVLSFGGEAELVEPASLRDAVRETARRILETTE
ncbi:MAG: WYL domain-containing protein [Myxococcales bacterium]